MIRLYWAEVSGLSLETDSLPLSEYRRKKLIKISSELKKKQSLGAELLLLHAVNGLFPGTQIPLEISCMENGKPVFDKLPLFFSLSHSANFAACAISDEPLGLDVEHGIIARPKIVERYFNADEQALYETSEDKDSFFAHLWTAKESALKYTGEGLGKGLSSVEIKDGYALIKPENISLKLSQFCIEGTYISLATKHEDDEIQIMKIIL